MKSHNVLVIGAGIGGLATALALHARGHAVTVVEAAPEARALGVGINLLPHAVAVLDRFGIVPALIRSGVETEALLFANRFGQTIHRDARGLGAGAAFPQISIHRGQLQQILFDSARLALGGEAIRFGCRCIGLGSTTGSGATARFMVDGRQVEFSADAIVACDGIHSAVRQQFYPDEGPPRWNGVMMWRGTTLGKPFLGGRTMVQAGIGDAKFVVYPISTAPDPDGNVLINWIADIRTKPRIDGTYQAPARQDWMKPGSLDDLLPTFGSWSFDWLDVPEIIRNAQGILEWPMVDRDPLPRWSFGRIALAGDAAHPMYPIGSNGATQAILDADALSQALSDDEPVTAFESYERARRPMTSEIVRMNRMMGLDAVLDLVDELAPTGFARIEDVIDPAEIASRIDNYKLLAGHARKVSA